jgi:general secretion pathway protein G
MKHYQGLSEERGVTLIELIFTMAILSILMTGVIPLSQASYKRAKEIELKYHLRTLRTAIDSYKKMADEGLIPKEAFSNGYPATLEVLVQGIYLKGPEKKRVKFLRRIPRDPMTEEGEWGMRSYADDSDSAMWGGQDVYDVYSKSDKKALDGTSYKEW